MIYQSADKTLKCIREVFCGSVNNVYICEDTRSQNKNYYTLWVIHNHEIARRILEIFEHFNKNDQDAYLEGFSSQDKFCVVLDFKKERPLFDFYMGVTFSLEECEMVCMNLMMECISAKLPFPILYLILTQRCLHLAKDKSIYFSYELDLKQLDESKTEADCVIQCASILMVLLKPKKKEKAISYRILELKVPKRCYMTFTQLYKDVKLAAVVPKKKSLKKRVQKFFKVHQSAIFRTMLVLCIILGGAALIMVISQAVLGDIPMYRLFINPFKLIGTQSLLQ